MTIDGRVQALGLVLPEPFRSPTGTAYPFSWVCVRGNRAHISGHLRLQADGTLAEPRGKVGEAVTIEQGAAAARLVGLAMLGSLQRELGLVLPEPFRSPTGTAYPFSWVRVRGNRAYISGHLPLQPFA